MLSQRLRLDEHDAGDEDGEQGNGSEEHHGVDRRNIIDEEMADYAREPRDEAGPVPRHAWS